MFFFLSSGQRHPLHGVLSDGQKLNYHVAQLQHDLTGAKSS